jgi:CrcB protein
MLHPLLVGCGGFFGSIARYSLGNFITQRNWTTDFPAGTFAVNVIGCLAIGLLWGLTERVQFMTVELRFLLITGFLGGFTTFSAFSIESLMLLRRGEIALALLYCVGSVALGLCATWLGLRVVQN